MPSQRKQNILVVTVIVLCFAVTLGFAVLLDGKGIIGAVFGKNKSDSVYMIAVGGYDDMQLARATSELIKGRGGAGYIVKGEDIKIVYAVYPSEQEAESVLDKLGENSAYITELSISSPSLKWADEATKQALKYYDITFEKLYELSNSLNGEENNIDDVRNGVKALKAQLDDLKAEYYAAVDGEADDRITQVKLGIITAIALVENIKLSGGEATVASSLRYQLVQLVLCRQALMSSL